VTPEYTQTSLQAQITTSSLLYCNDDMEETDNDLSDFLNADESSPAIEGDFADVQHGSKC
jgi:hypothetical protein